VRDVLADHSADVGTAFLLRSKKKYCRGYVHYGPSLVPGIRGEIDGTLDSCPMNVKVQVVDRVCHCITDENEFDFDDAWPEYTATTRLEGLGV
jgi:hypothetical protein